MCRNWRARGRLFRRYHLHGKSPGIEPYRSLEAQPGDTYEHAWFGGAAAQGQATMEQRFQSVKVRFEREIKLRRIIIHRADSNEVVTAFPDNYFEWVYIDGNHLYEYVKKDLEAFYSKVQLGGWLCGDDYGVAGWWENGVQRAVDEFVASFPVTLEILETQFLIRKNAS